MCGHVGIAGSLDYKDEKTFQRLLLLDYFRGPDSTGVAVVDKAGTSADIAKIASHPLDLFDTKRYQDKVKAYQSSAFIGHNRAATRGKVNGVNAHPFAFGHIVGCHNGTLTPSSFIELEKKLGEKFDVDSAAIFASIERFGIKETMPMLQGAWALVWFDLAQNTLNFLRNKERPFWYAYAADFKKLFWASEYPMIKAATQMAGTTNNTPDYVLYKSEEGYTFWQTEVDTHYRYDIHNLMKGEALPKPTVIVRKGKEPPVVTTTAAPFGRVGQSSITYSTTSTTSSRTDAQIHNEVVNLYAGPNAVLAGYITKEAFEKKYAAYGCSWCGEAVDVDKGFVAFEHSSNVLCHRCAVSDTEARFYIKDITAAKELAA